MLVAASTGKDRLMSLKEDAKGSLRSAVVDGADFFTIAERSHHHTLSVPAVPSGSIP